MFKKKDEKEIDPMYKDAKMSMLKSLRDEMAGMMKNDLGSYKDNGFKKVQVEAPDKEHLVKGLEKAKEMLSGESDEPDGDDDEPQDMESDSGDDYSSKEEDQDKDQEDHEMGEHDLGAVGSDVGALTPDEEEILKKLLAKKGM